MRRGISAALLTWAWKVVVVTLKVWTNDGEGKEHLDIRTWGQMMRETHCICIEFLLHLICARVIFVLNFILSCILYRIL